MHEDPPHHLPAESDIEDIVPPQPAAGDLWIYRIVSASLGMAVVAFVVGAAVIGAAGNKVPDQYWAYGNTLAGALLGILLPTKPAKKREPEGSSVARAARAVGRFLSANRVPVALALVFILAAVLGGVLDSPELLSLAGATGGALLGVLIPSPVGDKRTAP